MSFILGIETATFCGGVALLAPDRLIGSRTLNSPATHAGRLLLTIESLLTEAEVHLEQIGGLAVSIGPGSFTGVRIGLSAAKGLAVSMGAPLVGVSTLEALAVRAGRDSRLICPVIDARRNEVFASTWRWAPREEWPRETTAPAVLPIEAFVERLTLRGGRSSKAAFIFLGDGALRYRNEIETMLGDRAAFAPAHRMLPSAEEVAWLGLRRLASGESADPATLEPIYIRSSDAKLPLKRMSPKDTNVHEEKRS